MGLRSPFMAPIDKREEADKVRKAMGANHSDHLTTLRAYEGWQQAKVQGRREANTFCHQHFLSRNTLEMIEEMREQFRTLLAAIGFIPASKYGGRKGGGYGPGAAAAAAGAGGGGRGVGGGGEQGSVNGDWVCAHCRAQVFASKNACFKCRAPRPPQGGAGRGGAGLEVGCKVMAKFYGDGSMNLGLVRGKVRRGGAELLQVEFVGYEADGVQETQVSDCRLVEAPNGVNGGGGGGTVSSIGGAGEVDAVVLEVGCRVLAKFYEDGSMNSATGAERAPAMEPPQAPCAPMHVSSSSPGFCNRNAANYHILKVLLMCS